MLRPYGLTHTYPSQGPLPRGEGAWIPACAGMTDGHRSRGRDWCWKKGCVRRGWLALTRRWSPAMTTLTTTSVLHVVNDAYIAIVYPLLPLIAADLQLSYGQIGLLKAAFSGVASLFQLPMGAAGGAPDGRRGAGAARRRQRLDGRRPGGDGLGADLPGPARRGRRRGYRWWPAAPPGDRAGLAGLRAGGTRLGRRHAQLRRGPRQARRTGPGRHSRRDLRLAGGARRAGGGRTALLAGNADGADTGDAVGRAAARSPWRGIAGRVVYARAGESRSRGRLHCSRPSAR